MRLASLISAMSSEKNRRRAALVVWLQWAVFHCGDDVQVNASRSSSIGGVGGSGWLDAWSGKVKPTLVAVNMGSRFSDLEMTAVERFRCDWGARPVVQLILV